ncbi:MAG: NHL repeat-containing protein [Candidatus Riflebacteria bacterium]|nr:NHL repeat-containing protein [Candidatus Riflebacteria bacterium]
MKSEKKVLLAIFLVALFGSALFWTFSRKNLDLKFNGPTQIAFSPDFDTTYIFDSKNKRILAVDNDFKLKKVITHPNIGIGWGLTVKKNGNIVLVNLRSEMLETSSQERRKNRISELLIFSDTGELLKNIAWYGENAPIFYPQGVFCPQDGGYVISDTNQNMIFKLDEDGKPIFSFGEFGKSPGKFYNPSDVYVTDDGSYIVCDCYNSRIQKFSSKGIFQAVLIEKGANAGCLMFPQNFCFDENENFYCTESGNMRISTFDRTFKFKKTFVPKSSETNKAEGQKEIFEFYGIEFNKKTGKLYVVDSGNSCIQLFDREGNWLESVTEMKVK